MGRIFLHLLAAALATVLACAPGLAAETSPPSEGGDERSAGAVTASEPGVRGDEETPATRPASSPRRKSADEEIEEIVGPVLEETMTVTASRNAVSILDAPVSVSVVGAERISTTPADNLGEVLRGVPGLNVVQTSARDVNMKTRGAASTLETGQLALVDGRSLYLDFFGFVMWDLLPVAFDEIEQVEVLRGPGSAVWGANALNGVINVRTKSPRELAGVRLAAGAGTRETREASARWAAARDEWSWKVSGAWYQQEAWPRLDTLPNGEPFPAGSSGDFVNRGTRQIKLDFRADHDAEDGRRWSWRAGAATTSGIMHSGIGPFEVDEDSRLSYLELDYRGHQLDAKLYANVLDGQAVNLLNELDFIFDTRLWVAEVDARRPMGRDHLLLYGGNARLSDFDLSIAPRGDSREEVGAYVEAQLRLAPRLSWTIGARLDHFDTIGATLSPRTSFIFKPRPNQSIRVAYNRAYRAPSLVNNFLETEIPMILDLPEPLPDLPYTTFAVGQEELDEEIIDAFELGYTLRLGRRATFTAAVYRNFTKDVIDFFASEFYSTTDEPPSFPPGLIPRDVLERLPKTLTYRNVGRVRDQGLELGLEVAFARGWNGVFSYTWQDVPSISDDLQDDDELELNVPPRHLVSAAVHARRGPWSGAFSVSWTDDALWTDVLTIVAETDSHLLVNGSLARSFRDGALELSLEATNLLDEDVQQHAFGDVIGLKVATELKAKW